MSVVAVVGAGPGLGRSIAARFAAEGHRIAVLARSHDRLDRLVAELAGRGHQARAYPADVTEPSMLTSALARAAADLGQIDVLAYTPAPTFPQPAVQDLTYDVALGALQRQVLGAVTAVEAVLPSMRRRNVGSLLFTTGPSAIHGTPLTGAVGIASGGLRNYVHALHDALHPEGVFAGLAVLDLFITPGSDQADPDRIADRIHQLHQDADHAEIVIGDLHSHRSAGSRAVDDAAGPADHATQPHPTGTRSRC